MLTRPPAHGGRAGRGRHPRGVVHGLLVGLLGAACSSAPPYSGWTPEQLYEHGQRAFDEGDWGEARRAFERLVLTFPGFDQAVDARYMMAEATYRDSDYLGAISEFRRLVDLYPDHARADQAWMGLCRANASLSPHSQRDQTPTMQAQRICANVGGDFAGTEIGDSAAVIAGRMTDQLAERAYDVALFYFRRKLFDSAEIAFLDLLCLYPASTSAPEALERLIDTYEEWDYDEPVEQIRARLQRTCPSPPEARGLVLPAPGDTLSLVRSRAPPLR